MAEKELKTIVYKNGDILNLTEVKELLFKYWGMSEAEKRAVKRMINQYPDKHPNYDKLKDLNNEK